jgi:hypothetical protein
MDWHGPVPEPFVLAAVLWILPNDLGGRLPVQNLAQAGVWHVAKFDRQGSADSWKGQRFGAGMENLKESVG